MSLLSLRIDKLHRIYLSVIELEELLRNIVSMIIIIRDIDVLWIVIVLGIIVIIMIMIQIQILKIIRILHWIILIWIIIVIIINKPHCFKVLIQSLLA